MDLKLKNEATVSAQPPHGDGRRGILLSADYLGDRTACAVESVKAVVHFVESAGMAEGIWNSSYHFGHHNLMTKNLLTAWNDWRKVQDDALAITRTLDRMAELS